MPKNRQFLEENNENYKLVTKSYKLVTKTIDKLPLEGYTG
jgi:hypothetical protein